MSLGTIAPNDMSWPNNADGDVFRRLERSGFDFAAEHVVDFNIDLVDWPPAPGLIAEIRRRYAEWSQIAPEDDYRGYIEIQVRAPVTYEFVISMQRELSELAGPFGGVCESWGVTQHRGKEQ